MDASLETARARAGHHLGFGRVGRMVADMLDAHDKDYLAIEATSTRSPPRAKDGL